MALGILIQVENGRIGWERPYSLELISEGLRHYPGALVVVSHQPRFLQSIGIRKVWTLESGAVRIQCWDD